MERQNLRAQNKTCLAWWPASPGLLPSHWVQKTTSHHPAALTLDHHILLYIFVMKLPDPTSMILDPSPCKVMPRYFWEHAGWYLVCVWDKFPLFLLAALPTDAANDSWRLLGLGPITVSPALASRRGHHGPFSDPTQIFLWSSCHHKN